MRGTVHTTMDTQIHDLLRKRGIAVSEALEFGAKFLICEQLTREGDSPDYPQNSLSDKLARAMERLSQCQPTI